VGLPCLLQPTVFARQRGGDPQPSVATFARGWAAHANGPRRSDGCGSIWDSISGLRGAMLRLVAARLFYGLVFKFN
jgi:hypothetical protein